MQIDRATLKRLWPRATDKTIDAVVAGAPTILPKYNINTPLRLAHFLAQISHESGGGRIAEENLNYTAVRIGQVWPSRPEAQKYAHNPRALANSVYNGRMGNRPGSDDGWNYRGRGLLQLTGRFNYEKASELTGINLLADPQLAAHPTYALEVAAAEFQYLKCLPAADADDIRTVTKRVNGGYIGIDDRRAWLAKWKLAIKNLPGELPPSDVEIEEMDKPLPREADGDKSSKTPAKSKTLWSVLGTIFSAIGSGLAAAFSDWRVVVCLCVVIVFLALFIGRERLLKLWEDHV